MDLIQIFDTVTGRRIDRMPAESWRWSRRVSGSGSLTVDVGASREAARMDLRNLTRPWRTSLGVVDSATGRVVAAGPVYQRTWDADTGVLTLSCADMWDLLKLRLVMDSRTSAYTGGTLVGADGTFPEPWSIRATGSLEDIARDLVARTTAIGPLPVVLPPTTGGIHERTWQVPDLASVASRLTDLTGVIDGPEVLFQPRLEPGGAAIRWHMLMDSPELVIASHRWDARRRAVPLISLTVDEDASDMVGDAWARAGAQDDQTLLTHHHDSWLEDAGWPLLQGADTSHTSVSQLATLTEHARSMTVLRSQSTEVINVRARRTDEAGYPLADAVTPGDHLDLRVRDTYLGDTVLLLKILEVSGNESEWVTVACRETIQQEVDA